VSRFDRTVLQVVPRLDTGGAERTTYEIASAICEAGGRALVATAGGRLAAGVEQAGGEIIPMPVHSKNPAQIFANAGRLARLIRKRGVDIVHARSRAPAWSALLATRRVGAPFVTTWHGAHGATGPLKRWYNSALVRSDRVIANSRFTADAIMAVYALERERLRIIPRGADLDDFDPARVSQERVNQLAADWAVAVEKPAFRVLLPARLTPWKGHEVAIEAAARLKTLSETGKGRDLTLVFCGGAQGQPEYFERLRAMINERGVGHMVHLVGDCADMPAAFAWADMVIVPSTRPEAFGRVAVEAGAMGKPVAAAAHGGALETVVDGETGVLVKPGDAAALASSIDRVRAMSADDREAMGEKARARAVSIYSAAAMCEATLRVYEELASERG